ncbi:MAG: hotdog fold domain-containing protein [Deltaproteobacteria bacterium]|nr:hotdog fold domain-containing protein [Deltaproteobacteria bacterium]
MAGAKILELFGDAATALCLRESGGKNEGLFRAYREVEFLAPAYSGDTVQVTARIIKIGNSSRTIGFKAYKMGRPRKLITRAIGTVVVR